VELRAKEESIEKLVLHCPDLRRGLAYTGWKQDFDGSKAPDGEFRSKGAKMCSDGVIRQCVRPST
jgi:hypothetical protein